MKPNETLLLMRQNLIKIYKKYENVLIPFIKFIIVFSVINMLGDYVGYKGTLNKVEVVLFLSLMGTFLPDKWMILGTVILIPLYIALVNPILGIITFIFFWVLYLLFMRLFPRESILIIITVIAFNLGLEMLLPILAALFGGYVCIIAIILGVFIHFVMPQFAQLIVPQSIGKDELLDVFTTLAGSNIKDVVGDRTMLSTIVVFFIVFSIVYIIRKQSIDYAHYLAIVTGVVMNLAGFILATVFLTIDVSIIKVILATILAAFVAVVMQFFSRVLDYQRAEVVSFEDEDNYYYVKVVPKIHLSSSHNKVKRVYNTKTDPKSYTNSFSIPSDLADGDSEREE